MKKSWLIALIGIIANALVSCGGDKEEVKTYFTVTFDAGGGTPVPEAQRVEAGKTAAAPATAPAKQGYLFVCWSADGTKAYDFLTPVTRDLTLRAKWQAESQAEYWKVAWELGGGAWPSEGDNHAVQVLKGGTLAEPAPPVKANHTFDGWYKEAILTNKVAFPYDVSGLTADFTLYAKWKEEGGNPSSNNHTISNAEEWNAAVAAVNAAGNDKAHTFTVTKSFSLKGSGNVSLFTESLKGITVTVKGQNTPTPEISLSTVGYLIYLGSASQKIVLENIVLKGRAKNNAAVLGVKSGEMVVGEGTLITGNTNTVGGAGGVDAGGKVVLAGGKISGNVSGTAGETNGHGGGVKIDQKAQFIMESGEISRNMAYGQGGGVHVDFNAQFALKGGNIFGNTAWAASSGARGGGVYNVGGTVRMSGGKINGYDWNHGNVVDIPEHFDGVPEKRDNCNATIVGATVMGRFGAALYSPSGDNLYGTFTGENFTKTGDFGNNIHIERDIEVAGGVRLNRFEVNEEIYNPFRGGMNYWGNFFNASTENVFLGLTTISGEWIALDMLVPKGNDRLVAGTYTFSTATGTSVTAYTFVDNDYTSYVQDKDKNKLKITGGKVIVSVEGTGNGAVYTIAMDCTLEKGGKVKGTFRGVLNWNNKT